MRRLAAGVLVIVIGACGGDDGGVSTQNSLLVTVGGSPVVTLAAIEGGAPVAIGVRLEEAPVDTLVVALTADPVVALDRTALTFTPADFDVPQPVVITAADDADVLDGAGELTLAATGTDPLVLPIAIADDDRVAIAPSAGMIVMEGETAQLQVALASDPGGPVTITVASSDAASATVQPATLQFAADWAVPQTVTVTAVGDADDLDEDVAIALGGLHAIAATVPVTVLDVDRQNFVIAPAALALVEGGTAGTFAVHLTQPPAEPLAIAVEIVNPAIATLSAQTLTFTAADHDVPQLVTVTPRADVDGRLDASSVRLTSRGLRDRAVALAVDEDATADVTAVAGDFLMTIRPGFSSDAVIRYRVTYGVEPLDALITYRATALRVDDAQPIGDPIVSLGAGLDEDERFDGIFEGVLPAEANPFSGTTVQVAAAKAGRIVDANLLCGTMTGAAGGIPLDGTTWGAVRITGPTLPAPVDACPSP